MPASTSLGGPLLQVNINYVVDHCMTSIAISIEDRDIETSVLNALYDHNLSLPRTASHRRCTQVISPSLAQMVACKVLSSGGRPPLYLVHGHSLKKPPTNEAYT